MKIRLVSRDRQVQRLCREGLAPLRGTGGCLGLDPQGRHDASADLSILGLGAVSLSGNAWENSNTTPRILLYNQEELDVTQGSLPLAMAEPGERGAVFCFALPFAGPSICPARRPPQSEPDLAAWPGQRISEETA